MDTKRLSPSELSHPAARAGTPASPSESSVPGPADRIRDVNH